MKHVRCAANAFAWIKKWTDSIADRCTCGPAKKVSLLEKVMSAGKVSKLGACNGMVDFADYTASSSPQLQKEAKDERALAVQYELEYQRLLGEIKTELAGLPACGK